MKRRATRRSNLHRPLGNEQLASTVMLGIERCNARSGARGGSSELSLALAPVAHPPRGPHLRDLQRTGVLTEVLVVNGEVGSRLATGKRAQREMAKSWGSLWCSSDFGSSLGGGGSGV
jgi:hypothetical protein